MTLVHCPVCGYASPPAIQHEVFFVAATGEIRFKDRTCTVQATQIDIFAELLHAYPQKVPFDLLHREIYGRSASDTATRQSLRQHLSLLRRALRRAGLGIAVDAHEADGPNSPHSYGLRVLTYVVCPSEPINVG